MLREFNFLKKLGEGSFGNVYLVRRISDGQLYALKKVQIMSLNDKDKQNALNEIRLLASVWHMNVVQYKESFLDVNSQTLCLVMEYAEKGDVLHKIESHYKRQTCFPEYELWSALIQCLCGLKALHDLNIMHRDIKCANILISAKDECKLADFNVSKVMNTKEGFLHTQTGTPYYASPEVWKDHPYGFKSDIWSLGCVLYEMAALRPPFKAGDMSALYKKVVVANYPPIPRYSQEFKELISMMLQPNPNLRPTAGELLSCPVVLNRIMQLRAFDANIEACAGQLSVLAESSLTEMFVPASTNEIEGRRPSQSGALLNTIKLPRVLRQLAERLPKPNYESGLSSKSSVSLPTREPRDQKVLDNFTQINHLYGAPQSSHQQASQVNSDQTTPIRSPRKARQEKQSQKPKKVSGPGVIITPQVNSAKFAAIEILHPQIAAGQNNNNNNGNGVNLMRPTSSKVGNFLGSGDKPQSLHSGEDYALGGGAADYGSLYQKGITSENGLILKTGIRESQLPANLPTIYRQGASVEQELLREHLQRLNSNKHNEQLSGGNHKVPQSHRAHASQQNQHQTQHQDELLPLMMLNPPIALFEEEDRQMFSADNNNKGSQGVNGDFYPDFLKENQQMTEQVNQVIAESGQGKLLKRVPHHQRSRILQDHKYAGGAQKHNVSQNDKENAIQPGAKLRKIPGRNEQAPLESISVNLSPPQRQYRHKFITRKGTSAHKQHSLDTAKKANQQQKDIAPILLSCSPVKAVPSQQDKIALHIPQNKGKVYRMGSQPGESREPLNLRQSNSLLSEAATSQEDGQNSLPALSPSKVAKSQQAEQQQSLKSKLQSHMYRRKGSQHPSRADLFLNRQSCDEGVKQVVIIVEEVEKKIERMQKQNSSKYDYSEALVSPSKKQFVGVSATKVPSLEMIRNEVKNALSKVSSSVDLGHVSIIKPIPTKSTKSSALIPDTGRKIKHTVSCYDAPLEEAEPLLPIGMNGTPAPESDFNGRQVAIDNLKKVRQMRRI